MKKIYPNTIESSIKINGLCLDFLLYRKRGITFKEWFVDMFNHKSHVNRKNEVFSALREIDLNVSHGERLGIVGSNGAGKTTLMKCIAGIYTPSAGTINVKGSITPLIDISAGFNPELTGRDNIYLHAAIRGMTRAEIGHQEDEIISFADIGEFIDVSMKYYSSGMVSRLAFSVATLINPEILILDEVFSAGDQEFVKKASNRIHEIIDVAHILLFVSHSKQLVCDLSTRVIWLDRGKIVADGAPKDVLEYYESSLGANAE